MTAPQIAPISGPLFVVRWIRLDGRDVRHRYYRRLHDAKTFATKLRDAGREARIYRTTTRKQTEA
jgi:hypothetical protein